MCALPISGGRAAQHFSARQEQARCIGHAAPQRWAGAVGDAGAGDCASGRFLRPRSVAGWRFGGGSEWPSALQSRSEEHTSELQSLMRISYAVFCLKKTNNTNTKSHHQNLLTNKLQYLTR